MGGKTSHLFLGGQNGWWYQVSGTKYPIRDIFVFSVDNLYLSSCLPVTY